MLFQYTVHSDNHQEQILSSAQTNVHHCGTTTDVELPPDDKQTAARLQSSKIQTENSGSTKKANGRERSAQHGTPIKQTLDGMMVKTTLSASSYTLTNKHTKTSKRRPNEATFSWSIQSCRTNMAEQKHTERRLSFMSVHVVKK